MMHFTIRYPIAMDGEGGTDYFTYLFRTHFS